MYGQRRRRSNNAFLKKGTENGAKIDQIVYVGERKVPLRLIVEKVPEEVKDQRSAKYKSVRKKEPTEKITKSNKVKVT